MIPIPLNHRKKCVKVDILDRTDRNSIQFLALIHFEFWNKATKGWESLPLPSQRSSRGPRTLKRPSVYTIPSLFKDILIHHLTRAEQNQLCSPESYYYGSTQWRWVSEWTPTYPRVPWMQITAGSVRRKQWTNARALDFFEMPGNRPPRQVNPGFFRKRR